MPLLFKQIATYNPFVLGDQLIKEVLFYSFTFSDIMPCLLILFTYCVVLFLFSILVHRNLMLYMLYHLHKLPSEKLASSFKHRIKRLFRWKVKAKDVETNVSQGQSSKMECALVNDPNKNVTVQERIDKNKVSDVRLQRLKKELEKL